MNSQPLPVFIWKDADLVRGDYQRPDYGKIILRFTVLRRLDRVLESTKAAASAELSKPGVVCTISGPTAGTDGMLLIAEYHLTDMNP